MFRPHSLRIQLNEQRISMNSNDSCHHTGRYDLEAVLGNLKNSNSHQISKTGCSGILKSKVISARSILVEDISKSVGKHEGFIIYYEEMCVGG